MKIRDGFVSNSSTSSFMIMGVTYNQDEILSTFNVEDAYDVDDKFKTLQVEYGYDGEYIAVGLSPHQMKDTETLLHFKKRIVDELNEAGLNLSISDLDWHEDAFQDG